LDTQDAIRWQLADSGVLTLTINRPEVKNAIDTAGQFELLKKVYDASRHPKVKVVVLTGEGNAFCTGADVRTMGQPDPDDAIAVEFGRSETWNTQEARIDRLRHLQQTTLLLHRMGKPTIAKLRGAAAGMGLSFALACDFRLASDTVALTTSFAKIGLSGDFGANYFLTQLLGPSRAKELMMFSERLGPAEALALGLVNRVLPDAELDAAVEAWAQRLADGPTIAWRAIKENVHAALDGSAQEALDLEARNMVRCRTSEDCGEAMQALQQKRAPQFKGR
jgi:2-(1,2-epoxy-1,2-dihydrophenyl)acetyl-CoA isomerase